MVGSPLDSPSYHNNRIVLLLVQCIVFNSHGKGQSEIAKHLDGDPPLSLSRPIELYPWRERVLGKVILEVKDRFDRWFSRHFRGYIDHGLEVFVIDGLLHGTADKSADLAESDQSSPGSFDLDVRELME